MLLSLGLYWTAWDRLYAGLKLGRAPRTKETLPDFLKWRRVTRPPLIFRGLTGSQRTPGFRGVTAWYQSLGIRIPRELGFGYPSPLVWFGMECRCGSLEMEVWSLGYG